MKYLRCLLLTLFVAYAAADNERSSWSEWSACSKTCGRGVKMRSRKCDNPPRNKNCRGKRQDVQSVSCTIIACLAEAPLGIWSEWSPWTKCSASCGEGTVQRFRICDSATPCEGATQETQPCPLIKSCARDGQWSSWSQWSHCSVSCGSGGSVHRYRSCTNPPPSEGGKACEGSNSDTATCSALDSCPVNGHWSDWSEWTDCSVECGNGEQRRWRNCDNPAPLHGGLDCNRTEAGEMQIRSCNGGVPFCPVDGGWSEWSNWGNCYTPNCSSGSGYSFKTRSCSVPYPEHGGSMCQGIFITPGFCPNPLNCPVNGQWSDWSSWKCDEQGGFRLRTCNNPAPSNGGKTCQGDKHELVDNTEEIFREVCPDVPSDDEDFLQGSGSGSRSEVPEDG